MAKGISDVNRAKEEASVIEAIALMPNGDRIIGQRLHDIITANAPLLWARTWYGMPAYTDGKKIVCWFRSGKKFGERYVTLGFNDSAKLDQGTMWPITYALTELSLVDEANIADLVQKSVSEN